MRLKIDLFFRVQLLLVLSLLSSADAQTAATRSSSDRSEQVKPGSSRQDGSSYTEFLDAVLENRAADLTEPSGSGERLKIPMVYVPGGTFSMGSAAAEVGHNESESPRHTVKVSAFWIGRFEVTRDVYFAWYDRWTEIQREQLRDRQRKGQSVEERAGLPRPGPPYTDPGIHLPGDAPVVGVTPYAAQEFCRWLSLRTGRRYRLPTEAEWEYAARAGSTTAWHFGNDQKQLGEYAWYRDNAGEIMRVGLKAPNAWGLYDMYGNASEWVLDGWTENYGKLAVRTHQDPWFPRGASTLQVCRGGDCDSVAPQTRSAAREKRDARGSPFEDFPEWWNSQGGNRVGFRIVSPATAEKDSREASLKVLGPAAVP